jgi:hypothetical protein
VSAQGKSRGALALLALGAVSATPLGDDEVDLAPALATIRAEDVKASVTFLASPALEGRDSPSVGLEIASRFVCEHFAAAGLVPAADSVAAWTKVVASGEPPEWAQPKEGEGTYLRPYQVQEVERRKYSAPVESDCSLDLEVDGKAEHFEYGRDYVPVLGMAGDVRGELVFAGFGIESEEEHYDDFDGLRMKGKIALILDGEPRHAKRFEGPETTEAASLWRKVVHLEKAGAAGVVVARRPPPEAEKEKKPAKEAPSEATEPSRLSFRYTWAFFQGQRPDPPAKEGLPMVEVSLSCASKLLGEDVGALGSKIDRSAHPTKAKHDGRTVSIRTRLEDSGVRVDNVVGVLPGHDPARAAEWVIVGAHYDHIGVSPRGLIGFGADDNGSGTAALLEIVEAMATTQPARSVLFVAFSGEEDGLVGSARFAAEMPFAKQAVVAMVNLDMIGRGERDVAMVLGTEYNPDLERVLDRARRLEKTGIKKIDTNGDQELFKRSDQYSFHQIGIPTVFFMEDLPLATNTEYHTWKDTVELLDLEKIANTAKLAFDTAWLLANDDDRPSAPRD